MAALTSVLGLGIGLPLAVGATPAHAQSIVTIDKSHEGNFQAGGQGVYTITLTNSGNEDSGETQFTDNLPPGLTVASLAGSLPEFGLCDVTNGGKTIHCGEVVFGVGSLVTTVTVDIAENAPCAVTNTVTGTETTAAGTNAFSDSERTTITGDCNDDNGGGGGSILPISLNGVIPMFNNITTNNNVDSPGASNDSAQVFRVNAP
ncbi:hypothetical protein ACFWBN_34205 [Streptomyces sp. NPDC059989]|uniref:hypothetical protein n=1 Tax=Streptomyces sp. NPDC059989 TaxID=3347026 RepID=UPI0036C130DE